METIEDIVREMREGVVAKNWFEQTLKEFADRIEKAYKAETEALDKTAKDALTYITKVEAERDHEKKIAKIAIDNIVKIRADGVMLVYDMKTDADTRGSFSPADVRDYIRRLKDALFPIDRTDEKSKVYECAKNGKCEKEAK